MANKYLTSYNKDAVEDSQSTTSGEEPTEEGAVYIDALHPDEPIFGANGKDLLARVYEKFPEGFISREQLKDGIQKGELKGSIRPERSDNPTEYDCIIFDLSTYDDPAKAREVIIEALSKPDYVWQKSQKGGFTPTPVKGNRSVIAWGIHTDQQGMGPHFHAFIHNHAIDPSNGNKVSSKVTVSNSQVLDLETANINKHLQDAGLAPIKILTAGQSPQSPAMQEAKEVVAKAAISGKELELPTVRPVTTSEVSQDFEAAAIADEAEAARRIAEANQLMKSAAVKREADKIVKGYHFQQKQLDELQTKLEELQQFQQQQSHELGEVKEALTASSKDREAIAQALCETVGIEVTDDVLKLPASELEKLAGEAYQQNNQQLVEQLETARQQQQAAEQQAELERQEKEQAQHKVADLAAKHTAIRAVLDTTGHKDINALATDFESIKGDLQSVSKEKQQLAKVNENLKGSLDNRDQEVSKLNSDNKAQAEELAKLRKELEAERKAKAKAEEDKAEEIRKAAEKAAKEAEKKAKDEMKEVIKSLQKTNAEITKKAQKDQEAKAKAEGALEATKQALDQANKMNKALTSKLTATAPTRKPAAPK